jgi:hypothetical protein
VTGIRGYRLRSRGSNVYRVPSAKTSGERARLRRLLGEAPRVVFEANGPLIVGERADGTAMPCQLHPRTNPYVGKLAIGLAGRTRAARSRLLRRRALRHWTRGSVLVARGVVWVPADCWTPRVFAEAGRRLYMRLCDPQPGRVPVFEWPNRWREPDGLDGAIAWMRAHAEDDAFAAWQLDSRGRARFAAFGRAATDPLASTMP